MFSALALTIYSGENSTYCDIFPQVFSAYLQYQDSNEGFTAAPRKETPDINRKKLRRALLYRHVFCTCPIPPTPEHNRLLQYSPCKSRFHFSYSLYNIRRRL